MGLSERRTKQVMSCISHLLSPESCIGMSAPGRMQGLTMKTWGQRSGGARKATTLHKGHSPGPSALNESCQGTSHSGSPHLSPQVGHGSHFSYEVDSTLTVTDHLKNSMLCCFSRKNNELNLENRDLGQQES